MTRFGLAKLVLAIFLANAPLCPCAALADAAGQSHHPAPSQEGSASAHDAAGHTGHDIHAARAAPADARGADCLSAPAADCDMADERSVDGRSPSPDRFGDGFFAVPAAPADRSFQLGSGIGPPCPRPSPHVRLPLSTPVADHDRLLI